MQRLTPPHRTPPAGRPYGPPSQARRALARHRPPSPRRRRPAHADQTLVCRHSAAPSRPTWAHQAASARHSAAASSTSARAHRAAGESASTKSGKVAAAADTAAGPTTRDATSRARSDNSSVLNDGFPGQQQGRRPGRPCARDRNLSDDPIGQRQAHRQRDLTRCVATRVTPRRRGERPPQIRNTGRSRQARPRGRQPTQLKRRRDPRTGQSPQVITHVRGLDRSEQRTQHHDSIPRLPPRQHPQVPQHRRDDRALSLGQRLANAHIVPVRGIRQLRDSQLRRRAAGESPRCDPAQTSPGHRIRPNAASDPRNTHAAITTHRSDAHH